MSESYWTDKVALTYRELEEELVEIIIKRLKKGTNNKKDITQWQFEKLQDLGLINIQTIQKVVQATGQAEEVVEEAFRVGPDTVISQVDRASQQPRKVPKTNIDQIIKGYANQARTQLNMTGEGLGLWTYGSQDTIQKYRRVIERTASFVNTGIHTLEQAVQRASHEILTEGLKTTMHDKNGRKISVDSYVRTVMKTNLARTYDEVRKEHMEDYGMHHVVVGSLVGAREACSKIQGQVVDLRPVEEIPEGSEYRSIYDPYWEAHYKEAGGHHGINCRHPHFPFIPGVNTNNQPQYDEALNEQVAKDQQRQRSLERQIREYKKHLKIAQEFGNQEDIDRYTKLISGRQKALREHLDGHKYLSRDYARERAFDFSTSKTSDIIEPTIIEEPSITFSNNSIEEKLTKSELNTYETIFEDNAPEKVQKVWSKYSDDLKLINAKSKDGDYYSDGKGVYINIKEDLNPTDSRSKGNTFYHEFGHNIDYVAVKIRSLSASDSLKLSNDKTLGETIFDEVQKHIKEQPGKLKKDRMAELNKALRADYIRDRKKGKAHTYMGVSDLFGGSTGNEVSTGWGHSKSYWKKSSWMKNITAAEYRARRLGNEGFAAMFAANITAHEEIEVFKKWLPESYEAFEELLDMILEEEQ